MSYLGKLDEIMATEDDHVAVDSSVAPAMATAAFDYHSAAGGPFSRYVERVREYHDSGWWPLVPSTVFKERALSVSEPAAGPIALSFSSGTRGSTSAVPRDDDTLMRFFGTIGFGMRHLLDIQSRATRIVHVVDGALPPRTSWLESVLQAMVDLSSSSLTIDVDDRVSAVPTLEQLRGTRFAFAGTPPNVMKLAQLVVDAELDLAAAPDALIVTAGGWKVAERDTIDPQEFRDLASASLSMKVSQVRDCYGMVELNTAIFSCTSGRLHVPPWLSVRAHDARGRILAGGREGVLGFVDPSATSYAAFVLSDDVGVIEEACQCGRSGETLRVTRRLSTIEGRGCALRIDGSYLR